MNPRYAIYFAPAPDTPLWAFGCSVIGYDAATGCKRPLSPPDGIATETWRLLTQPPRRYGFHATMKAPFHLSNGVSLAHMLTAFDRFCETQGPIGLDGLKVTNLDGFAALVPVGTDHELRALAQASVEAFEPFRAPLVEADRARRLQANLTSRQIESLDRYGYPYVGADFRFHITLSDRLPELTRDLALRALERRYRAEVPPGPLVIDRLALFVQPSRDDGFRILVARSLTGSG